MGRGADSAVLTKAGLLPKKGGVALFRRMRYAGRGFRYRPGDVGRASDRGYGYMGVHRRMTRAVVLAAGMMAAGMGPLAAQSLRPQDLAGPGQGVRDVTIDMNAFGGGAGASTMGSGILGGLSSAAPAAAVGEVHIQTVPDRLPSGSFVAPRAGAGAVVPVPLTQGGPAPGAVPDVRLRPVPTALPAMPARPMAAPVPSGPGGTVSSGTLAPATGGASSGAGPFQGVMSGTGPNTVFPAEVGRGRAVPARTASEAPDAAMDEPAGLSPAGEAADGENATLIRADELIRDTDLGIYKARGNVELVSDGRIVRADVVAYSQRTDILTASGNVRVLETDGTAYFANYVELTSDFKDGFVRDMSVLLIDRSRIAAPYATRTEGRRKDFWNGVYTACDTCAAGDSPWPTLSGDNDGARERQRPLWQVRAAHAVHDEEAHELIYHDATIEMLGVPIFYTPYMSQPDPTVYRRSGVLSPTYGNDERMGFWAEVPYYVVIDDHQDATIAVRGIEKEGWLLRPEYRYRFGEGEFYVNGSVTEDEVEGWSGHVQSWGLWNINEVWRTGFETAYASHDLYMTNYDFGSPDWLTNHGWVEAFQNRSYASAELFHFNDTRTSYDDDTNPFVLPVIAYDYVSEPGTWGDTLRLWSGVQSIYREEGADSHRVSGTLGWTLPGAADWGLAYEVSTDLNTDFYWVADANTVDGDVDSGFDGSVARVYPDARMTLSYPLIRTGFEGTQVLEPIASVGMAPSGMNTHRIPNEDSQDAILRSGNLFSTDRFSGRDRVDDGLRAAYGLRWSWLGDSGGRISVQAGQAYRMSDASDFFPENAGYGDGLSDYVVQVEAAPHRYLDVYYRTRLDRDDLSAGATTLGFVAGPRAVRVSGTYVSAQDFVEEDGREIPYRQEALGSVTLGLNRYWSASVGARYNVRDHERVNNWFALVYNDECLDVNLRYTNRFTKNGNDDDDLGESLMLRVVLKTVGEISY